MKDWTHRIATALNSYIYSADFAKSFAGKLDVPVKYVRKSHMPADFMLQKEIHIEGVGELLVTIWPSKKLQTQETKKHFIRTCINCPICGKFVALSRFPQHSEVHMDNTNVQ